MLINSFVKRIRHFLAVALRIFSKQQTLAAGIQFGLVNHIYFASAKTKPNVMMKQLIHSANPTVTTGIVIIIFHTSRLFVNTLQNSQNKTNFKSK